MVIVEKSYGVIKKGYRKNKIVVAGVPFRWRTGSQSSRIVVVCHCDCGTRFIADIYNIMKESNTTSCGCEKRRKASDRLRWTGAHKGLSRRERKLFAVLKSMRHRCESPKNNSYANYGGRGITVCDQWRCNPEAFIEWAKKNGYEDGLEIDRIDNNKGYSPDNCRFTTRKQNALNRRSNVRVSIYGEEKTVLEWSRDHRCEVSYVAFATRIRKGVPPEIAIRKTNAARTARGDTQDKRPDVK